MSTVPSTRPSHLIKPHHVLICVLLYGTFHTKVVGAKHYAPMPEAFHMHVLRLLTREIAEVIEPLAYAALFADLEAAIPTDNRDCKTWLDDMEFMSSLNSVETLHGFFGAFESIVPFKEEESEPDHNPTFQRRSLFGLFVRRCYLSYMKLSVRGVEILVNEYVSWRNGTSSAYEVHRGDNIEAGIETSLLFKTATDTKTKVRTEPFTAFEDGMLTGNEVKAADSLRAYFEQHFHDGLESGNRQHALLHLSRMHYQREEYTQARRLLEEAQTLCRVKNDRATLMHCMALLHRLPPKHGKGRPPINEIQPDLHPLEILYDVRKLLQEEHGQPLTAAFRRITEAMGLRDLSAEAPAKDEQWAHYAVQAIAWSAAGRERLADAQRDIVLRFTAPGTDDDSRFHALLCKAYHTARQGSYDDGLAVLLHTDTWRGITFAQYHTWAAEVWHVLVLRASRMGMHRVYQDMLQSRRPTAAFDSREYWFDMEPSRNAETIKSPLYDVLHMRRVGQGAAAISKLLVGLWRAEYQGRYDLYRLGMILLADVGLEFGMTRRCVQIMEEIMPQIHASLDVELRGMAFFTMARAIVATKKTHEGLREALVYAQQAEQEYKRLQAYDSLADINYLIAVFHHNLGEVPQRDAAAGQNAEYEQKVREMSGLAVDEKTHEVWKLVSDVGIALSMRR